jgi:16S rRNA processing protein RimM
MAGEPDYLVVGTVRKPHGVRGEVQVQVETDRPDAVFRKGRALLLGDAQGHPLGRSVTVERARPFKGGFLLQASEYASRTQEVEDLRGRTLLIPASEAAPLDEGEVFYHDLVGLSVRVEEERIGTVREVIETAGADLLVVRRPRAKDLLVPFIKDVVREVDLEARELRIDPPEGLLDL